MSAAIDPAGGQVPAAFRAFRQRHALERAILAGQEWSYRQTTPGAPVLLALPGALGTGDVFYRTATHLAPRFNVVTLGYPACDDSAILADGLAALLDALGAAQAAVLSSSLGGYVAQVLALRHPRRIRLAILGNTFRDPASQQARWPAADAFAAVPAETVLADARQRLVDGAAAMPAAAELKAILLALVGADQDAAGVRAARLAVLRATALPTLTLDPSCIALVDDDEDPVIAPETRADMRQSYAGCRHERIPGGGHYPSILAPEAYHRALDRLLAKIA
jgi:maspardin